MQCEMDEKLQSFVAYLHNIWLFYSENGRTKWDAKTRLEQSLQQRSYARETLQHFEHDDLFQAIRQNKPYNEAEYGACSTMTAILGRMATYSGKAIKWDDALASNVSVMPKVFSFDADPPTLPDANSHYPIPVPGVTKVL